MKQRKLQLLVATHNHSKLMEIYKLLVGTSYELVSLSDLGITYDVKETGATFEENAILKAEAYCQLSGLPTLADDSGLEIDALNGAPGIYTKRFLGQINEEEKRKKLLEKLADVPAEERGARFTSVMALAWPGDGRVQTYHGFMMGIIATSMRGTPVPFFPYWNIFECGQSKRTCSELRDEGKNPAEHRAMATKKLLLDLI